LVFFSEDFSFSFSSSEEDSVGVAVAVCFAGVLLVGSSSEETTL
jgi:hypothetical protein